MPQLETIAKASLQEIEPGRNGAASTTKGDPIPVQFNPQTLKLNYTNQQAGHSQPRGSGSQFTGRGVTKLALELYFDVTAPDPNSKEETDVRKLTEKVAYFITPKRPTGGGRNTAPAPPAVRFSWGSFLFEGVMDSMNETLELFSSEGEPLRSSVSISLTRQEITYSYNPNFQRSGAAPGAVTAGTEPNEPARDGDCVQQMAARAGKADDWKSIAAANNIENPRMLAAGMLVNLNAKVGVSAGGSIGFGAGISAGASFSAGATAGASFGAGASAGAGFGAGASAGAGFSAGASVSAGASAGAGFSASAGAEASIGD